MKWPRIACPTCGSLVAVTRRKHDPFGYGYVYTHGRVRNGGICRYSGTFVQLPEPMPMEATS